MLKKTILFALFAALSTLAVAAQAKTVEIEGTNSLRFSQESITVKPGEEVTIKLVNNSKLPASAMAHNWLLLKSDADAGKVDEAAMGAKANDYVPEDMSDQIIAHTGLVGGGESDTVTFTAPEEPGDYTYICTFPGHFQAGMKGTLTVKAE
ncbi:Electron transfer protein azurin I [Salinisphaera shabanensis E1L3A]|jgi:azurin|uniref:Electron transfer protein azurin I n=1 Tax=Salinisphaera shabanensis E1L3A TaxID=1033802 RepID=U2G1R0_9GAMM|nr:plastocyanin/azurin family copper-binding protein [Salinisphaera shabanensis]ERJ20153.1 Electron transfer protein azurin I [Salinisphaera shabanensis E1L3A]|tara:strand:+ start:465 stop:917 length:453 start_codon:yes stop_codon:yes gene_type:complete